MLPISVPELTQEFLKSRLEYRDGCFYWRVKPVIDSGDRRWNTKYSGKRAGSLDLSSGYRYIGFTIKGKRQHFLEHRLVFIWFHGHFPKGQIDHEKGIKDQNWIEYLRDVSSSENNKNKRMPKNNTSGVMGVSWHKPLGKWRAGIMVDYKTIHLGYFYDKFEAICARKSSEVKYRFHENHGRKL